MKIKYIIVSFCLFLLFYSISFSEETGNLLVNGNASNNMNGWVNPQGAFKTSTSEVSTLDGPYFWPGCKRINFCEMYQDIPVKQYVGKTCVASVYVRDYVKNHGDEQCLVLEFFNNSGVSISSEIKHSTKQDKWLKLEISKCIPYGAVTARIILRGIRHNGSDCDSYFDNASFKIIGINSNNETNVNNKKVNNKNSKLTYCAS